MKRWLAGLLLIVIGQAPVPASVPSVAWQRVYRGDVLPEAKGAIQGSGKFRGLETKAREQCPC